MTIRYTDKVDDLAAEQLAGFFIDLRVMKLREGHTIDIVSNINGQAQVALQALYDGEIVPVRCATYDDDVTLSRVNETR